MENVNPNVQRAAEQFAQRLTNYPIEEQIAVGCISSNVLNGCSWEFVRRNRDIESNLDAFKASKTCSCQKVTYDMIKKEYGYLVYMKLDRLLGILQKDAPGLIEQSDLDRAAKHHQEAILKLAKLMSEKHYQGQIGIYCTNDSPTITKAGKTMPAFSVTLKEALQICSKCNYGIVVMDKIRTPNEVFERANAFLEASIVAPSGNAIFINIAPLGNGRAR